MGTCAVVGVNTAILFSHQRKRLPSFPLSSAQEVTRRGRITDLLESLQEIGTRQVSLVDEVKLATVK